MRVFVFSNLLPEFREIRGQEQKHFTPLGTKLYFNVHFSIKISIVLPPNMVANQELGYIILGKTT